MSFKAESGAPVFAEGANERGVLSVFPPFRGGDVRGAAGAKRLRRLPAIDDAPVRNTADDVDDVSGFSVRHGGILPNSARRAKFIFARKTPARADE